MTSRRPLLIHLCCAPCGTVGWSSLLAEGWDARAFFWGGNIHARDEWIRRRDAVTRLSGFLGAQALLGGWDPVTWLKAMAGLENEPEGGLRCHKCYELQLEMAAAAAQELGIQRLCTSLTTSRRKDPALINEIGRAVALRHGLTWEERVWRKNDGNRRSRELSREFGLYRQNYCGCMISLKEKIERDRRRSEL